MGKSRLKLNSKAFWRQMSYYAEEEKSEDLEFNVWKTNGKSYDYYRDCVYELYYKKRGDVREKALLVLVDALERYVLVDFVETTYVTLLDRCINSIKVGVKVQNYNEVYLASRAIGLMGITITNEESSKELMEASLSVLFQSLTSVSDTLKISGLESLAIVTFFGANSVNEVEESMRIMWGKFYPWSTSEARPSSAVLTTAIYAWSFLLTSINMWRISSKLWKESLSIFLNLLEDDDYSINIAAHDAIVTIIESGKIDKFSEEEGSEYSIMDKIKNQVRRLYEKAMGKGKDLKRKRDLFQPFLAYLLKHNFGTQMNHCLGTLQTVYTKSGIYELSTLSEQIQLKFLKRFLGRGYEKHLQDNEVLQDIFNFDSWEKQIPFPKVRCRITLSTHKQLIKLKNKRRFGDQNRRLCVVDYAQLKDALD